MNELYTVGHSTHSSEKFIELLEAHSITAVCDVRSSPYSKHNPQFNRETVRGELKKHGIAYVYLGKELGPRSGDPTCYENGRVSYEKLAETELFRQGLDRLRAGMKSYRIAMMCAEKDPVTCHRTILICRNLGKDDVDIRHILEDGSLEKNRDAEKRLMRMLKIPETSLFDSPEDLVQRAYGRQGEKIAYKAKPDEEKDAE